MEDSNDKNSRSLQQDVVDKIIDDSALGMVHQDNLEKFQPYMEAMGNALIKLSQKYRLGVEKRMQLRQRLLDWLGEKLSVNKQYPPQLAEMGFNSYGERYAKEAWAGESKNLNDVDMDSLAEIIDDSNGKISNF